MSKKKFNKMWPDAMSPESTRPKQSLKLPQNTGVPYVPNLEFSMSKAKLKKVAANRVILAAYRALGRKQAQHHSIEMIARELVALKNLKIEGPIDKYSVAEAISPGYAAKPQNVARRKSSRAAVFVSEPVANSGPIDHQIKEFYASWEWKRLSYDVKLERGRTCECCGAKAPKVVIHTDHIKPLRKYWHLRLDRTNMQVLCEDCNMGKGSRDETDFRAINEAEDNAPQEPDITDDELERLTAIRQQLRLN